MEAHNSQWRRREGRESGEDLGNCGSSVIEFGPTVVRSNLTVTLRLRVTVGTV